ncbi:hypothetical protein SGPA1_30269 [Streptomyces misionensis JCM 4497]
MTKKRQYVGSSWRSRDIAARRRGGRRPGMVGGHEACVLHSRCPRYGPSRGAGARVRARLPGRGAAGASRGGGARRADPRRTGRRRGAVARLRCRTAGARRVRADRRPRRRRTRTGRTARTAAARARPRSAVRAGVPRRGVRGRRRHRRPATGHRRRGRLRARRADPAGDPRLAPHRGRRDPGARAGGARPGGCAVGCDAHLAGRRAARADLCRARPLPGLCAGQGHRVGRGHHPAAAGRGGAAARRVRGRAAPGRLGRLAVLGVREAVARARRPAARPAHRGPRPPGTAARRDGVTRPSPAEPSPGDVDGAAAAHRRLAGRPPVAAGRDLGAR